MPPFKLIDPDALAAAFVIEDQFHRVDWEIARHWVDAHVEPLDQEAALNEVLLYWVTKLRDDLGANYFILQSRETVVLCDLAMPAARWLLAYSDNASITIKEKLGTLAWRGASIKNVILMFSDEDDYYQYVAYHMPEGEQPPSGGMCIHSGQTQIAVTWRDEVDAANAILHELTHSCLAHLTLPLWLNEGIAVTLQKAVAPPARSLGQSDQDTFSAAFSNWQAPIMWDELAERHFSFWTETSMQSFWSGASFYIPGDSNELSYSLAEVLLKLAGEGIDAETMCAFIAASKPEDAGQAAAIEILDKNLGEVAGTFLGPGNWQPDRKAILACCEKAGWKPMDQSSHE